MENVQTTHMKVMKMYGNAGLFTGRTIVILKNFETQSQKQILRIESIPNPNRMRIESIPNQSVSQSERST